MFSKLAEQHNHEVEQQTKTIGSLLELILIAVYMPLFQLSIGIKKMILPIATQVRLFQSHESFEVKNVLSTDLSQD
jgi:hypothetical protein